MCRLFTPKDRNVSNCYQNLIYLNATIFQLNLKNALEIKFMHVFEHYNIMICIEKFYYLQFGKLKIKPKILKLPRFP